MDVNRKKPYTTRGIPDYLCLRDDYVRNIYCRPALPRVGLESRAPGMQCNAPAPQVLFNDRVLVTAAKNPNDLWDKCGFLFLSLYVINKVYSDYRPIHARFYPIDICCNDIIPNEPRRGIMLDAFYNIIMLDQHQINHGLSLNQHLKDNKSASKGLAKRSAINITK